MKSTPPDYKRRSMAVLCQEALEILREYHGQPLGCGLIGGQLFRESTQRGSAPFARLAGKVMKRLECAGLVRYGRARRSHWAGWLVTAVGLHTDYEELIRVEVEPLTPAAKKLIAIIEGGLARRRDRNHRGHR